MLWVSWVLVRMAPILPSETEGLLRWPICRCFLDMGWMWSPRELCVDDLPAPEQHPSSSLVCPKEFASTVVLSSGLGALPARFRRERLLIVGCGDVGMRVARNYVQGVVPAACGMALTSSPERKGGSARVSVTPLWET